MLGPKFKLMQQRGTWQASDGPRVLATVHPSWVLRQRDAASRDEAFHGLVEDLRVLSAPPQG